MDPQATPYDILGLPQFAWVPSMLTWLIFLLFATISFALLFATLKKRSRTATVTRALDAALAALRALEEQSPGPLLERGTLDHASLIVKRFLTTGSSVDFSALSSEELRALRNLSSPSLSAICEDLVLLEDARYRPQVQVPREALGSLRSHISSYFESVQGEAI